jgi:hypothetical protein
MKKSMKIISHRGYWKRKDEKNSRMAFERAIESGFGIETDIRDCCGKLVISHDMPNGGEMSAEDFFSLSGIQNVVLALNIKADGLQNILQNLLQKYNIVNYFVFDMSVPDTIGYMKNNFNIALRHSEYEKELPFYGNSTYVWLDCFNSNWFTADEVQKHLNSGKKVCVVSPDLNELDYNATWQLLKNIDDKNLAICTDLPQQAQEFFSE